MTIKDMGKNRILNVVQENIPSEILLNGHITNFTKESTSFYYGNSEYIIFTYYIFTNEINQEIIIKWNKTINNMYKMFYDCYSITSLDLSTFNTSSVIDMSYMLFGCFSLISLNLTNFDTSSVTNMRYMFNLYSSEILDKLLDQSYLIEMPLENITERLINLIFLIV